jgi:hypothetical protein
VCDSDETRGVESPRQSPAPPDLLDEGPRVDQHAVEIEEDHAPERRRRRSADITTITTTARPR